MFISTFNKIIYRWWKITLRNDGDKYNPGEIKDNFEDFDNDETIKRMLVYIHLTTDIFTHIFSFFKIIYHGRLVLIFLTI